MKRSIITMIAALTMCTLAGGAASAATAKHVRHHAPTCKQINGAIDGGKSAADVEKEMHVTAGRVKACASPAVKKAPAPSEKQS